MPRRQVITITAGVMLSLFLASMESTVVATGMPTIVSQLGGLNSYSWVFSAYMLTSTTTMSGQASITLARSLHPIAATNAIELSHPAS